MAPGLIVQFGKPYAQDNAALSLNTVFYGLTASRKVGNAVLRNRARRRLRALAHEILLAHAPCDRAYVLIARPATIARSYDELRQDLLTALQKMKAWRE